MRNSDTHILEFLRNEGNDPLIAPPKAIAVNIGFSASTVRRRVRLLREAGLIEYYDQSSGLYQITDRGHRYFSGDLSDAEVEGVESVLD